MREAGTASTAEPQASRLSWLFVILATLNLHWGLGTEKGAKGVLHGPPSSVQLAALQKLVGAADAMIRLSPGQLGERDWKTEVGRASVSYEGEEVSTALPLVSSSVLPGLRPKASLELWRLHRSWKDTLVKLCCPLNWCASKSLKSSGLAASAHFDVLSREQ